MPLYAEGILWYIVLLDCIVYNIFAWTGWRNRTTHWISQYFPINKWVGIWYLIMVLWLGYSLLRMDIILFQ